MKFAYHEPMEVTCPLASWTRRDGAAMPELRGASAKRSVFLPLGELDKGGSSGAAHHEERFMERFNALYFEHISGFKKAKKEKGEKERNMEWRLRLAEKRKRDSARASAASSSSSSSEMSSSSGAYFYVSSSRSNASAMSGSSDLFESKRRKKHRRVGQADVDKHKEKVLTAQTRANAIAAYKAMKNSNSLRRSSNVNGGVRGGRNMPERKPPGKIGQGVKTGGRVGGGRGGANGNGGGKRRMSKAERKKLAKAKRAANSSAPGE